LPASPGPVRNGGLNHHRFIVFPAGTSPHEYMSRSELEALFLKHLDVVDRILSALARRHALDPDDAADLCAWAKARMVESDYAALAKFRGESALGTYLTVVLSMLAREYMARERGRWRPSAAARRHGAVGVKLEALIVRNGLPLSVAGQMMRSAGETTLPDAELARIAAELPPRASRQPVRDSAVVESFPADNVADDLVQQGERSRREEFVKNALEEALKTLSAEDALIVRLHFVEGLSVADVSRSLCLPQKPLYRRLERLLVALRGELERRGVTRDECRGLWGDH
jgi:RNA polymerase sigma factor for flagellar operon FliA